MGRSRRALPAPRLSGACRCIMPFNDVDYDELIKTLTDNFNVLADEVQLLSDRKQILEHKLRFAHEQFQYLADKYASSASGFTSLCPRTCRSRTTSATNASRFKATDSSCHKGRTTGSTTSYILGRQVDRIYG